MFSDVFWDYKKKSVTCKWHGLLCSKLTIYLSERPYIFGNKAKGPVLKRVLQESEARQIF